MKFLAETVSLTIQLLHTDIVVKVRKYVRENHIQKDFITNKKSYYNKENLGEK